MASPAPAPAPGRGPVRAPWRQRPPVRHLQIVTDPTAVLRARRRRRLLTMLTVVLALGGMFAVVGLQVFLTQGQGQLDALEARVETEQARHQQLRLRTAELESPARIVSEARTRFGMVPVKALTYLAPPTAAPSTVAAITVATALPTTTVAPATTEETKTTVTTGTTVTPTTTVKPNAAKPPISANPATPQNPPTGATRP